MQLVKKQEQAAEVVSHNVEPVQVDTDSAKYSRIGWLLVLLGFGGFVLWALFAPLDKGVPMSGTVAAQLNRQAVQHQAGGTLQELLVRDGDQVKAGQVLVRMNPISAQSAVELTEVQYLSALANVARLSAERDGLKKITFPAELEQRRNEAAVADMLSVQEGLMVSRQNALQSQLASVNENIEGLKLQITGLQEARDSKKQQVGMLKEQLGGMRDLAKEGYVARNRLFDLERTYAELNGQISEDIGTIGRSQRQVMELTLRKTQALQDYQKEVRTQMSEQQREADAHRARLTSQKFDLSNIEVRAPVAGTVVGLAVFTNGGVVPAGFKMMDIVPAGDALVVEGHLPVNLIDKVYPGLKVELIFSAFNSNKTPHIEGEVVVVAADRQVDERTGAPYYVVKAKVTPKGHQMMAEHKMDARPGMPVELFVKTGERTMMNYLFRPIIDRMPAAMGGE
jgi:protease secretion system membrane fusion protein